jgi:integrase
MATSNAHKLAVFPKPKRESKPRKRVKGEGTIYERGNVFWYELHWKGQRFRGSLDTSDRETALIKWDVKRSEIRSGELPRVFEPITVQSMFDIWIEECERTCKSRTVNDYRQRWKNHLKGTFGGLLATQVTKDKVAGYLHQRMKEGAGPITQNRENRVLQMIFNYNRDKIAANNFPTFPPMHSEKNHVRKGRLSAEDYRTVMARLEDPKMFWLKVLVTMTFKYGFRYSELLNATVGYFDPKASVFTLPAFTTKNKMERRVPIKRDGEIYQMLVQLTAGRNPKDALFTRKGVPVRDYRGAWAKVTEGITNGRGGHVTIHDLRRSAITAMSNKGIGATQAGTHLTRDVFDRYISRSDEEEQATAGAIEGD